MRVDLIELDDWIGIYFNLGCVYQGHSIHPYMLFELLLGREINEFHRHSWEDYPEFDEWAHVPGELPEELV